MGSVKDLTILKPAYENLPGVGRFNFSDRYSVFDWGQMPDNIKNKGKALAVMAACNFEGLEDAGVKTHYRDLIRDGKSIGFSDLKEGENGSELMEVDMGVVYRPTARQFMSKDIPSSNAVPSINYDYSIFDKNRGKLNNYLIGLEIIFRNGLPEGSSVFKRIAEAKRIENPVESKQKLQNILNGLGLEKEPKPGDMLPRPVMNYTTKLEPGDRTLSSKEAYDISGLKSHDFAAVEPLAMRVNDFVTKKAQRAGLDHYDGKIEMLYNNGLVVCDVVGTFDEDRFGFKGEQVSKEFLRQWYKKNQPDFEPACEQSKKTGEGWQKRCPVKPIELEPSLTTLVSQLYMSGCNKYVDKNIFDAPELEEVMNSIRPFR
jgi:phosphoribosylaminoimidazole-succinocarboxamide synthase